MPAVISVFLWLAASTCMTDATPETISLRDCLILIDDEQPAYVRRGVEDLERVIERFGGKRPQLIRDAAAAGGDIPVIKIGTPLDDPGEAAGQLGRASRPEAFVLTARAPAQDAQSPPVVTIAADDPGGLKFGIVELIRRLDVSDGDVRIACPLEIAREPRFATRGMYAHLHWWYHWPYALRSWKLEDWKRYADLLTHLGFNAIQMWPMMELLPHPLSADDEAYLGKYREVIDYLHEHRGMKAFIGSCANNITPDARGVPIEKREYFDFEVLLDPGVPENLDRILAYRSDLYRIVPNADGYWVIDADPGGWEGSPPHEFVDILSGHRALLDRYGERPDEQAVIYWMWESWGSHRPQQNYGLTLADLMHRVDRPWRIHVCKPNHFELMVRLGLTDRAIFFPYNLIEDEPSGPLTDLRFTRIEAALKEAHALGITAAQGNAQTPLVQLPNIMAFSYAAWGGSPGLDADPVLSELADRLVCKHQDVLVSGWKALLEDDVTGCRSLADRVRKLAKDASARGTLTVIIGVEWQERIIEDLAVMLELHASAVELEQIADRAASTSSEAAATLTAFVEIASGWMEHTGYHNNRIIMNEPYYEPTLYGLFKLRARLGADRLEREVIEPAISAARQSHNPDVVSSIIDTVRGHRR